jgi:gas vesicle protein
MTTEGTKGMNIVLTFCGGLAVGAVATLLLTPKSGRELREGLADYARRGASKTAQLPEAVKQASGAAKEAFNDTMANSPS